MKLLVQKEEEKESDKPEGDAEKCDEEDKPRMDNVEYDDKSANKDKKKKRRKGNHVGDLAAWFPTMTTLVLYHDLRLHLNQAFRHDGKASTGRLERVLGTTPGLGCDHLYFCATTASNLLANNPKETPQPGPTSGRRGFPQKGPGGPLSIPIAHHCFPSVTSLELTFSSHETLAHVVRFSRLTHLSLIGSTAVPPHPFSSPVVALLARLPLKHLSLTNFRDVSVPTLAMACPGLESLTILAGSARDEFIVPPVFHRLRRLRLSCFMRQPMLVALLHACRDLVELHLEEDYLSGGFLTGPAFMSSPRPSLTQLERLTLRTRPPGCNSVVDLRVSPSDLDAALAELPALRQVRTDNFKIRFHLDNGAARPPPIALEWLGCSKCFSEYPKVSSEQQELWANVHFKKVGKGVAPSGMMMQQSGSV
ncbi:hypothetical protein HPB48_001710 [Haemaphysalis longicornis]|uniref:Uncharacterized protein n=1 Tax=Haemaphysalis longicornis TaxID=44386 RepID=A0A9J6GX17_HAELO|nr:hypothetical protein HPB48_001710 [Haemaphysalis longicornis]